MKQVLVIYYSQSGQLTEILNNIVGSMQNNETAFTYLNIEMEEAFPFPWNKEQFFGVFPETFRQEPRPIKPIPDAILNKNYDLILFGYSVWYLTPSLPTTSFLATPEAKKLINNTPVITVIGCRNMWIMAQEKIKHKLQELQANLVGNIVLVDRHINHISVITIVQWMFTGVKKRFLGIFPKPGVSQKDIDEASKFGGIITKHLAQNDYNNLQNNLLDIGAVKVKPFLITVDKRANAIFSKWAHIITTKSDKNTSKRRFFVKLFNYYLLIAIWLISPLVFILFLLTYLPFYSQIKKDKVYYASVALKEKEV
ncbi:dialkylrecorsinol condensing enzyme DarA [Bizionia algoritergicola]|uniref:Dialkylresorcinol condensing enzyme DarA n=1 Tax=Bizionia algoritergicola TaxID=291187 RepID=A0A5D0R406_9FLAO|nr:dialkylrecorsinol condensing enzyme DarA [Bizionia algoritergicola]TYB75304.1 dialkylresorcinol condensing enzyme DarA [Bizionia algoritergicola]